MHIYFSGIGGVGLGPLALLALEAGYKVTGSDKTESELTKLLEDKGVEITYRQDGQCLADTHKDSPIDWFVYSSALPKDHPELVFAEKNNIKLSKRAEFLKLILKEKNLRLIAVSGTHGKTTTTGMLIWLFKQLGVPISYSIGTTISFGPPAAYVEGSEFFIYECDEFDRNFLNFQPSFSLITSLDYDHVDTYPTQEDYNYAFNDFINQSSFSFMWQEAADQLGINDQNNLTILSPSDPGRNMITLPGEHNRRNAWLALSALHEALEVEPNKLVAYINNFPGTNRRFEKLAENIYSDYAHHPVEIAATIEMAEELNPKVVVIYQPHQNIRQHEILREDGYQHCFDKAATVYWLPTYLSREYQDLPLLSPTDLIATTSGKTHFEPSEMNDDLWRKIEAHQKAGDLVVGMSAGDLDYWLRQQSS